MPVLGGGPGVTSGDIKSVLSELSGGKIEADVNINVSNKTRKNMKDLSDGMEAVADGYNKATDSISKFEKSLRQNNGKIGNINYGSLPRTKEEAKNKLSESYAIYKAHKEGRNNTKSDLGNIVKYGNLFSVLGGDLSNLNNELKQLYSATASLDNYSEKNGYHFSKEKLEILQKIYSSEKEILETEKKINNENSKRKKTTTKVVETEEVQNLEKAINLIDEYLAKRDEMFKRRDAQPSYRPKELTDIDYNADFNSIYRYYKQIDSLLDKYKTKTGKITKTSIVNYLNNNSLIDSNMRSALAYYAKQNKINAKEIFSNNKYIEVADLFGAYLPKREEFESFASEYLSDLRKIEGKLASEIGIDLKDRLVDKILDNTSNSKNLKKELLKMLGIESDNSSNYSVKYANNKFLSKRYSVSSKESTPAPQNGLSSHESEVVSQLEKEAEARARNTSAINEQVDAEKALKSQSESSSSNYIQELINKYNQLINDKHSKVEDIRAVVNELNSLGKYKPKGTNEWVDDVVNLNEKYSELFSLFKSGNFDKIHELYGNKIIGESSEEIEKSIKLFEQLINILNKSGLDSSNMKLSWFEGWVDLNDVGGISGAVNTIANNLDNADPLFVKLKNNLKEVIELYNNQAKAVDEVSDAQDTLSNSEAISNTEKNIEATKELSDANEQTANTSKKETEGLKEVEIQADKTSKSKEKTKKKNKELSEANEQTALTAEQEAEMLEKVAEANAHIDSLIPRNVDRQYGLTSDDEFSWRETRDRVQRITGTVTTDENGFRHLDTEIFTDFEKLKKLLIDNDKALIDIQYRIQDMNRKGVDTTSLEHLRATLTSIGTEYEVIMQGLSNDDDYLTTNTYYERQRELLDYQQKINAKYDTKWQQEDIKNTIKLVDTLIKKYKQAQDDINNGIELTPQQNAWVNEYINNIDVYREILTSMRDAGIEVGKINSLLTEQEIIKRNIARASDDNYTILNTQYAKQYLDTLNQIRGESSNLSAQQEADLKRIYDSWKRATDAEGEYNNAQKGNNNFINSIQSSLVQTASRLLDIANLSENSRNSIESLISELQHATFDTSTFKNLNEQLLDFQQRIRAVESDAKNDRAINNEAISGKIKEIDKYLQSNTSMSRRFKEELKSIRVEYENMLNSDAPKTALSDLNARLNDFYSRVIQSGQVGKSFLHMFTDRIKRGSAQFLATYFSLQDWIRYARTAITTIRELDTALIDLKKTTTMNVSELNEFYYASNDIAKSMGVTTKEIIEQASSWSRLGYSTKEQAETMAKISSQFAAISPGMTTDQAQEGLVSIMKAWQIDVKDVSAVMDAINKLGNSFAETNLDIVEGMERSAAALSATGTSYQEAFSLFTGAQEVLQSSEIAGRALRSISMRIRGFSEAEDGSSLTEVDEELKNISGDLIDLTKTAQHTQGVSIFKEGSTTEFKSLVDYFGEINAIWGEMSQKQQSDYLTKAFGKTQAQAGAALIQNYSAVKDAMTAIEESAGSADAEMENIRQSLDYKINALKETWVGLAQELIDRGDIGEIVDALTRISEVIKDITTGIGLLGTAGGIAGAIIGYKSNIKIDDLNTFINNLINLSNRLKGFNSNQIITSQPILNSYSSSGTVSSGSGTHKALQDTFAEQEQKLAQQELERMKNIQTTQRELYRQRLQREAQLTAKIQAESNARKLVQQKELEADQAAASWRKRNYISYSDGSQTQVNRLPGVGGISQDVQNMKDQFDKTWVSVEERFIKGKDRFLSIANSMMTSLKNSFSNLGTIFSSAIQSVSDFSTRMGQAISDGMDKIYYSITSLPSKIVNQVTTMFSNISKAVSSFSVNFYNQINELVANAVTRFYELKTGIQNSIVAYSQGVDRFGKAIVTGLAGIPELVNEALSGALINLGNFARSVYKTIDNTINTVLINGIKFDMFANNAVKEIGTAFSTIIASVKTNLATLKTNFENIFDLSQFKMDNNIEESPFGFDLDVVDDLKETFAEANNVVSDGMENISESLSDGISDSISENIEDSLENVDLDNIAQEFETAGEMAGTALTSGVYSGVENLEAYDQELNTTTAAVVQNESALNSDNLALEANAAELSVVAAEESSLGVALAQENIAVQKSNLAHEEQVMLLKLVKATEDDALISKLRLVAGEDGLTKANLKNIATLEVSQVEEFGLTEAEMARVIALAAEVTATEELTFATKALNIALNGLKGVAGLLIGIGISLLIPKVIEQVDKLVHKTENLTKVAKEAEDAISSINKELNDNKKLVEETVDEYAKLSQGVKNLGKVNQAQGTLSNEEYERFNEITDQLIEAFPQLYGGMDQTGHSMTNLSGDVNTITSSLENLLKVEEALANQKIADEMPKVFDGIRTEIIDANTKIANINSVKGLYNDQQLKEDVLNAIKSGRYNPDMSGYNSNIIKILNKIISEYNIGKSQLIGGTTSRSVYIFSDDEIKKIENNIDDYFGEISYIYDRDIGILQNEIDSSNGKLRNTLVGYLKTSGYFDVGEESASVMLDYINSLSFDDFSIINDNGSVTIMSDEQIKQAVDNALYQIQKQFDNPDFVLKYNSLNSAETVGELSSAYEELYNYLLSQPGLDPTDPFVAHIKLQVDTFNQNKNEAFDNLFGTDSDIGRDFVSINHPEWVDWFNNLLPNEIERAKRVPIDYTLLINSEDPIAYLDRLVKKTDEWSFLTSQKTETSVSKTADDISKRLGEQFSALKSTYQSIFSDGFDLNNIDNFDAIIEKFKSISDLNIDFDTKSVDDFIKTLSSGTKDVNKVKAAFNDLATEWLYSSKVLDGLNESNAELMKFSLKNMGIANSEDIVNSRLYLNQLNEMDSKLKEYSELRKSTNKVDQQHADELLKEINATKDDLVYTDAEIKAKMLETNATNETKEAYLSLYYQKMLFNNNGTMTSADINNLIALASTCGITGKAYDKLIQIRSLWNAYDNASGSGVAQTEIQKEIDRAIKELNELMNGEFTVNTSKLIGNAKNSGKDTADAWLEAYEKELEELKRLKDNGFIDEKTYLDRFRELYIKYFKDREKYLKNYQDAEHEYLEELKKLYEDVIAAVIEVLDEEIEKLEEQAEAEKEVLEVQKEANEAEIKSLEKIVKSYEKQQQAIDRKIEKLNEEIDKIDEQIEAIERLKRPYEKQIKAYEKEQKALDELINEQQEYIDAIDEQIEVIEKQMRPYEKMIKEYEKEQKAIDKKIKTEQKEIDAIDDKINEYKKLERPLEKQIKAYEKEQKALEKLIKPIEEEMESKQEEIDLIQDEIDKMNEANEERSRSIQLARDQYALAQAMAQKNKLININVNYKSNYIG